jgi:hypothetical protein
MLHSTNPTKTTAHFLAALEEATKNGHGLFEFTGYVFPVDFGWQKVVFSERADFRDCVFQGVNFSNAHFADEVDFSNAQFQGWTGFGYLTFEGNARFDGCCFENYTWFSGARFRRDASFVGAEFRARVSFKLAHFYGAARFNSEFADIVNFRGAHFDCLERVTFDRVNRKARNGLRLRAVFSNLPSIRFENLVWHRVGGRLVLQDELDLRRRSNPRSHSDVSYESVAISYRTMLRGFDEARVVDAAEDCFEGAMEMLRLDPSRHVFGWTAIRRERQVRHAVLTALSKRKRQFLLGLLPKREIVRFCGEQLSLTNAYRLLSGYGRRYLRAAMVLVGLVIAFAALYSSPVSQLILLDANTRRSSPLFAGQSREAPPYSKILVGMRHSIEVATFTRERTYQAGNEMTTALTLVEPPIIAGQLALVLLALRRTFKR